MRTQMRKSITTLVFVLFSGFAGGVLSQTPRVELKPDAPERYVVVPGDTLWSIAERYLTSPHRWPDLWNMNKETVSNPHRIYPGNVLVLDRAKGQLAVSETVKLSPRIRIEQTAAKEIPSIPPNLIEPYLSRPLVIEADGLERAPTIVATQENRVILGAGNTAYVTGLGQNNSEETWHIYRRGKALVDPEVNRTVGYEATFLGTARVASPGDPATIEIVSAVQEIGKGDKLVAAGRPQVPNYAPRAPSGKIRGQVMAIYGGVGAVGEAGRNSVVTLNRGKADGLETGHVLALLRLGGSIHETSGKRGFAARPAAAAAAATDRVPDERYGLVFVFRVFERVSYALVMDVSRPVNPQDVVQTP